VRRPEEQCRPEADSLGFRQGAIDLGQNIAEQVAERGEGQVPLRLGRPRLEHSMAPIARLLDGISPERRLADARLPLDDKADRAHGDAIEELADGIRLVVPAEEF
jgi:hypothetical protein